MKRQRTHASGPSAGSPSLRGALRGVVFVAGFAITAIEIALGRLLAPFFGASLAVWAAVIASIVAAMALGYPPGGRLADRRPDAALPLASLLLGALGGALLGITTPWWLGGLMEGVGLAGADYWLRLFFVLALFGLPCLVLATVSPAVLRVTLRSADSVGTEAGLVYAVGSLGSVLGLLLPALWWVPSFGLRGTFLCVAALALVPVLCTVMLRAVRLPRAVGATAILLCAALPLLPETVAPQPAGATVLHDADSGLQRIRVFGRDTPRHKRRWLALDEGWTAHSALLEPSLVTGGVWDWMAVSALLPRPDDGRTDVLIVGLAGGTVSNLMTRHLEHRVPDLGIVGVELDAQVIEVADRHLALDRRRLETVVADGRVWLRASERRFDLIVLDAYHQPSIPAHLATREFFAEVRDHLAPGGLAVLNVFAPAGPSELLDGLTATWAAVFERPERFTGPEMDGFAARLLFGGPALPLRLWERSTGAAPPALRPAWSALRRGTRPLRALPDLAPWTDDWSPVEHITDRLYRATRPAKPNHLG